MVSAVVAQHPPRGAVESLRATADTRMLDQMMLDRRPTDSIGAGGLRAAVGTRALSNVPCQVDEGGRHG